MKQISFLVAISLVMFACGGKQQSTEEIIATEDLTEIRAKKAELEGEYNALGAEIESLTAAIKKLDPQEKVPLITAIKVEESLFTHYVELQGNVTTKENIVIYPEYSGVLTQVYVKEGQRVKKGETLAKIDDGGLSQQLSQLEIQTDLAKTTYERQKRLWDQKIGSEMQYLQAKSTYEAQQKSIEQLKEQIAKTTVTAPFSGTIDAVLTDQGTVVAPGQSQLFRLISLSNVYVETDVPERYVASVIKGKSVEMYFPVLGETMEAEVRQAGDYINPANRTFKAESGIPQQTKTLKSNITEK